MNTAAIIQARMGSTRLPGKVLKDLLGKPMLVHVVERTRRAKALNSVIVATTTRPDDDVIARLCEQKGYPYFRGSLEDLLDRYYQTAVQFKVDNVVRITSDCPLIEPEIIDRTVYEFLNHSPALDYASNFLTRTFPRGLDIEVMSFKALQKAWQEDNNPAWREHVTPYIYRHPEKFQIHNVTGDTDYSQMRWTVDTPEDMELVRRIYQYFQNNKFTWIQVLDLLKIHPDWLEINQDIRQKQVL